jgi:hypothetical protein
MIPASITMPYLLDGEVLKVSKGSGKGGASSIYYDVLVTFPNGSRSVVSKVLQASIFGGIADQFQGRLRGTDDEETIDFSSDEKENETNVGDRVVVCFLGGDIRRPLIIGYLPHPKETNHFKGHDSLKPQSKLIYLGMEFFVDETGQLKIIHRGAPTIKKASGFAIPDLGSLTGKESNATKSNPAVEPAPEEGITIMEFLDDGVFTVYDYDGQQFLMDRTEGIIKLTNAGKKTIESLGASLSSSDGEYLLLDSGEGMLEIGATELISVVSEGDIEVSATGDNTVSIEGDEEYTVGGSKTDSITGDHEISIDGDRTVTIGGDAEDTISGNYTGSVSGDMSVTVSGDLTSDITGNYTVSVTGDTSFSITGAASFDVTGDYSLDSKGSGAMSAISGWEIKEAVASITMKSGKVAIKGATGELLALIIEAIDAISQLTVPTGVGPSGPPINAAAFAAIKVKINGMKG